MCDVEGDELVSSCRVILGAFWRCLGLRVLPSLALECDHETERVRLGRKSSITAGVSGNLRGDAIFSTCWDDLSLFQSAWLLVHGI